MQIKGGNYLYFCWIIFLPKKNGSEKKLFAIEPPPKKQQDAQLGTESISQQGAITLFGGQRYVTKLCVTKLRVKESV